MLERILQWDREALIYLNSLGVEEYDLFWSTVTNIYTWIPLFLFFFLLIFWKYPRKEAIYITLTVISLIAFILVATDLTKGFFERLRPNNNAEISSIIRVFKKSGQFQFFLWTCGQFFFYNNLDGLISQKESKMVLDFLYLAFAICLKQDLRGRALSGRYYCRGYIWFVSGIRFLQFI